LDVEFFPAVAGPADAGIFSRPAFARKGRQPYYVPHERHFERRPGRAGQNVVLELEAYVAAEVKGDGFPYPALLLKLIRT
jgi:hypothetical protein